jgi:hypothetical protein
MRPIDADTLPVKYDGRDFTVTKADIDVAPTIDLARRGHWVYDCLGIQRCSACGAATYFGESVYLYCYNCGAKMDEDLKGVHGEEN